MVRSFVIASGNEERLGLAEALDEAEIRKK
jgi:hypothetical protein